MGEKVSFLSLITISSVSDPYVWESQHISQWLDFIVQEFGIKDHYFKCITSLLPQTGDKLISFLDKNFKEIPYGDQLVETLIYLLQCKF